jgi:hypothetical protein
VSALGDRRLYDDLAARLETPPPPGRLVWERGNQSCYVDFDTLTYVTPTMTFVHQVEGIDLEVLA